MFDPTTCRAILKAFISQTARPDGWIWLLEKSGEYSVKSMYNSLCHVKTVTSADMEKSACKKLWKLCIHDRLKLLLWKVVWNMLLTQAQVASAIEVRSVLCNENVESMSHLILDYLHRIIFWRSSRWPLDSRCFVGGYHW